MRIFIRIKKLKPRSSSLSMSDNHDHFTIFGCIYLILHPQTQFVRLRHKIKPFKCVFFYLYQYVAVEFIKSYPSYTRDVVTPVSQDSFRPSTTLRPHHLLYQGRRISLERELSLFVVWPLRPMIHDYYCLLSAYLYNYVAPHRNVGIF